LRAIFEDIAKRPFILVGFLAWLLLVPLALTSTKATLKALGFPRWKALHRLSYLIAALAVVHFVWRVKTDVREPLAYGAVLSALLLVRAFAALRARLATRS
jgi:sulfoxide reductase heme-binding subunit YedZ